MIFVKSRLNRKALRTILIPQNYNSFSPVPPNTPKVCLGFSPQEYIEWMLFSPLQITSLGENCKTNLKTQNNLTFFSPTVKYQTSRSYSDLSCRALRVYFSDIPHTINTAFCHHPLSFLNLFLPNMKASELRGKEKRAPTMYYFYKNRVSRLFLDPPQQNGAASSI